jgi:hypothetical protein
MIVIILGYNSTLGGDGCGRGEKHPNFGKVGRITGFKNPMKNPETVKKVIAFHQGRKRSEETKKNISLSKKGTIKINGCFVKKGVTNGS